VLAPHAKPCAAMFRGRRRSKLILDSVEDAHRAISSFEFVRNFTWEIENHWEKIGEKVRNGRIKDGQSCSFERYLDARDYAERCRSRFADVLGDCDVLFCATATGEAPLGLDSTGNPRPSALWTTMHVPVITIPGFKGPHGLPVGAQLVARRNDDRRLFAAALWAYRKLS